MKRYYWIDNVKIIAVTLVALGHLFQGLVKAGILANSGGFNAFNETIYYFHVPLFFICSGFLYQRFKKINNARDYFKIEGNKLISLGVPFFVFSLITFGFKQIFADTVNTNNASLVDTLFVNPSAPYWFLYALFFIFLVSPIFKSKGNAIFDLIFSVVLYIISICVDFSALPEVIETILYYIFHYSIWFSLGMFIAFFKLEEKFKAWHIVFFIIFVPLALANYFRGASFSPALIYGLLACIGIISFVGALSKNKHSKVLDFIAKYTMPIFLMHTIFSAGARAILVKIGIENAPIHIAVGLVASLVLPIIAGVIMEKIKLDILYNPTKYIKIK